MTWRISQPLTRSMRWPTAHSGRSNRTSVNTMANSTRNSRAPPQAITARSPGTGAVRIEPSTATMGRAKSTPLDTMAVAANAAPTVARLTPDTDSMR